MIAHLWFIVASLNGHPLSYAPAALAHGTYPTRAACMADAKLRTSGFPLVNVHGRYLCMYYNESDAELARSPIATF